MVGFVNALGILIFTSQLPQLLGVPFMVYPLVAVGIIIMVVMPRFTKVVPAPLVAIVVLTVLTVVVSINVPTIGDQGELPTTLPQLFFPNVPLNLETLTIIAPYAFGMAMVGILESLMAAKIVDESTDTHSNKTRESWAQGASNMLSGFFGGQTMINVKASGARTRISTFLAGIFLLVLVLGLGDVLAVVPMAALVAVMIIVSVLTFDWHSIRLSTLKRMPKSETAVMVITVIAVVATHNLAVGVVIGVVIAMVAFARRVAHLAQVERSLTVDDNGPVAYYTVTGALFFASSNDLKTQFSYLDDPDRIVIDMTNSHIWDASTVATLDDIKYKYQRHDKIVTIDGLNESSSMLHARLAGNMGSGH
jgi:SulP family sulfate permease